jgi:hypothetical protein
MFIAVVGRPNPDDSFDGKIGVFRVARKVKCRKTNNAAWKNCPDNKWKYKEKGKFYAQDVSMDHKQFLFLMENQVIPEIVEKMSWVPPGETVYCQMDNATPHTGGKTIEKLNEIGAIQTVKIVFILQPPKSPDSNTLDLMLFFSWGTRSHKLQRLKNSPTDKGLLEKNVRKSFKDYPPALIERSFQNLQLVADKIIENEGGNFFDVPHGVEEDKRKGLPGYVDHSVLPDDFWEPFTQSRSDILRE